MSKIERTDNQMDEDKIDYGPLMHEAMRGLVSKVISRVSQNGLPGKHHFFITFRTSRPGVIMTPWLRSKYPEEMTIVIQDYYKDLQCDGKSIYITLNFSDMDEDIVIPLDAIKTFVDPSVEFGLRFEEAEGEQND